MSATPLADEAAKRTADAIGEPALGALAAQNALHVLRESVDAEHVLLLGLPKDASDDFRRAYLRTIEKALMR